MLELPFYLLLLITFLIFLALSFYFSGIEAGFLSLNRERFWVDFKQGSKKSARIKILVENISVVLAVALLGNNLSNITLVIVSSQLWTSFIGDELQWLYVLVSTLLLLIFGEIVPKMVFRKISLPLFYEVSPLLLFFYRVFSPVVRLMTRFTDPIVNRVFTSPVDELTPMDLSHIMETGQEHGVVEKKEKLFIENFSNLSNTKVEEIMTPLVDVFMVSKFQDLRAVIDQTRDLEVDMIPVYEKRIDNIIGFVSLTDILFLKKKKLIAKDFLKECFYLPESVTLEKVFRNFMVFQTVLQVVINEHGGCCGVIYTKNFLDNVFGFSYDPQNVHKKSLIHLQESGVYKIDPSFDIDNFNRMFQENIEKNGFETLGGWLIHIQGEVPKVGSVIVYKKYQFKINRAEKTSIEEVELSIR